MQAFAFTNEFHQSQTVEDHKLDASQSDQSFQHHTAGAAPTIQFHQGTKGDVHIVDTEEAFDQKHIAAHTAPVIVGVMNSLNWLCHCHDGVQSNQPHALFGHIGHNTQGQQGQVGKENIGNHTQGIIRLGTTGIQNSVGELPGARGA